MYMEPGQDLVDLPSEFLTFFKQVVSATESSLKLGFMDLPFCTTSENVKPDVKVFRFLFCFSRKFFLIVVCLVFGFKNFCMCANQSINESISQSRDTVVYLGRTKRLQTGKTVNRRIAKQTHTKRYLRRRYEST